MKKSRTLIIATALVVVMIAIALLSGCAEKANAAEADLNFDGLGEAPPQEAVEAATPIDTSKLVFSKEETTDKAVLDSILYLIQLSNQNLIDANFFAAGAYGYGTAQMTILGDPIVGSMQTRDIRVFDNGEYYFDTYGLVVDGYILKKDGSRGKNVNKGTLDMIATALNFTKRVYSPDGKTFYFAKNGTSNENSLVNFPDQNSITYKRPKVTKMTFNEYMDFTYSRNSYKGYTHDDYTTDQPILNGLLTYDADKGIYYLEAEINCDDATLKLSNDDMLSNPAINKFRYAKKRLKVEIWDSGLLKGFVHENKWVATIISTINGSSENAYIQWFSYDKSNLDKMLIDESLKNALI